VQDFAIMEYSKEEEGECVCERDLKRRREHG
jgi:hypothetical protein